MLLDGKNYILAIPLEKKQLALQLLEIISNKKKTTVKELQNLCGYLNFLCKAIFPGRAFVRRMYAKYSDIISAGGMPQNAYQFKLKQHHHVHIDHEFKLDCKVWIQFLNGELERVVNRPMIGLLKDAETSEDISFYSDASAAEDKGFGAILKNRWICVDWSASFIWNKNQVLSSLNYLL